MDHLSRLKTIEKSKLYGILKDDVVEKLKARRFTGRFRVIWEEGEIVSCKLDTRLVFEKRKREVDDDDFFDFHF